MHYRVKSTKKQRRYRIKRTRNINRNRTISVNRNRILRGGHVTDQEVEATIRAVDNIFNAFQVESETFRVQRPKGTTPTKCLLSTIKDGNTCLIFRVYMDPDNKITPGNKVIVIDSLDRCGVGDEGTGTALLQKVNELALSLPEYKYIRLTDVSTVNLCDTKSISVRLAHLKILTKGMSWYNSHGYFSKKHESDYAHNSEFIASKISAIIGHSESGFPPPVRSDETVQGYVSRLMESVGPVGTKCDENQTRNAEILKKVVDLLSPSLQYDHRLIKTVTRI